LVSAHDFPSDGNAWNNADAAPAISQTLHTLREKVVKSAAFIGKEM